MAKYVFSFRVPSDYRPNAGTPAEWQAWFGGWWCPPRTWTPR